LEPTNEIYLNVFELTNDPELNAFELNPTDPELKTCELK
jgi:hypothetical protein